MAKKTESPDNAEVPDIVLWIPTDREAGERHMKSIWPKKPKNKANQAEIEVE